MRGWSRTAEYRIRSGRIAGGNWNPQADAERTCSWTSYLPPQCDELLLKNGRRSISDFINLGVDTAEGQPPNCATSGRGGVGWLGRGPGLAGRLACLGLFRNACRLRRSFAGRF